MREWIGPALATPGFVLELGFSHFVTSMTAPIASGWSGCRVGLAPTGKRRLCTAHTLCGLRLRAASDAGAARISRRLRLEPKHFLA